MKKATRLTFPSLFLSMILTPLPTSVEVVGSNPLWFILSMGAPHWWQAIYIREKRKKKSLDQVALYSLLFYFLDNKSLLYSLTRSAAWKCAYIKPCTTVNWSSLLHSAGWHLVKHTSVCCLESRFCKKQRSPFRKGESVYNICPHVSATKGWSYSVL